MLSHCTVGGGIKLKLFIEVSLTLGLQETPSPRDCYIGLLLYVFSLGS